MTASENPLVSILMPAYNCEKYIDQAIGSILNQTYQNWELLIADDGSTDSTKKIISSFSDKRIACFHNKKNKGYLETWNNLISVANGEYIAFQDADDISSRNRIELQLNELLYNKEISIVGSNYHRINSENVITFTSNFSLSHKEIMCKTPEKFDILGSGLMIKREVYKEIGGYNTFFNRIGAEDYYWFYLCAEKFKVSNLKSPLYYYRENPNSIGGDWSDNPIKIHTKNILHYLIRERIETGTDSIESKNTEKLNRYINELNTPYEMDKSKIFSELSSKYFYEGLYKRSLRLGMIAIFKSPFRLRNYKNLLYFTRKIIFKQRSSGRI